MNFRQDIKARSAFRIVFIMAMAVAIFLTLLRCSSQGPPNMEKDSSFVDLHGLGVKPDGDLFIATHHGLFLLKNDKDLYRIGKVEQDLMGFSVNPWNPEHVYASGHPSKGGNLGVIVSQDGGVTWRQVFRGIGNEAVDFHAMAIGQAEPRFLYGWYQNRLYRTEDGGNTWKFASAKGLTDVFMLATSPHHPDTIYAGNNTGIVISRDKGETWSILAAVGPVVGLAEDTQRQGVFYAFTQRFQMAISTDEGKNWKSINNGLDLRSQEIIPYIALHPADNKILYAGTTQNVIFKSSDQGHSWARIK